MLKDMGADVKLVDRVMDVEMPPRVHRMVEEAVVIWVGSVKTLVTCAMPATQRLEAASKLSVCRDQGDHSSAFKAGFQGWMFYPKALDVMQKS